MLRQVVAHEASHMFHSTQDYYLTNDIDKVLSNAYSWGEIYDAEPPVSNNLEVLPAKSDAVAFPWWILPALYLDGTINFNDKAVIPC